MATSFTSAPRRCWLLLPLLAGHAPAVLACSFGFSEMPYGPQHYVFYGRVLGYATLNMEICGREPRRTGDQCPPAWGWQLEVVEPVHLPKAIKQVEYFEFTVDAACGTLPLGEPHVQRIPVGSLVTLVATPAHSWMPVGPKLRLAAPTPVNGLLAALPAGADPHALRSQEIDRREIACAPENRSPDARVAFEYWRDREALDGEKSERRRMEGLVRMMSVFDGRYFERKEVPTMHEKVVHEYLTMPALLDEFYARIPAARAAAHAGCDKN